MLDAHYTPLEIARRMIEGLPSQFLPSFVADFACGDGALLSEASKRWPNSHFIANDIDVNLTRRLHRTHGEWSVSAVDFLSDASLRRSKLFPLEQKVDCVLINPPFSEKGKARVVSQFFGTQVTSGSTMAFLLRALRFLAPRGFMVAVLPNSCFISERDRDAWDQIKVHFTVQKILSNSPSTFKGIAASTTVAILHYHHVSQMTLAIARPVPLPELEIIRGKLQMHAADKWSSADGYPLIHTSNLLLNNIHIDGCHTVDYKHIIHGPAVLVPRVGSVTREKVAILTEGTSVVMSDCVLAIQCKTNDNAKLMSQAIFSHWDTFRTAYGGTGAPYTTLERISETLAQCVNVRRVVQAQSKKHREIVNSAREVTVVQDRAVLIK